MRAPRRQMLFVLAGVAAGVVASGAASAAGAGNGPLRARGLWEDRRDVLALVPADTDTARRGREVLSRFPLGKRVELTLQVNNAFTAQNRRALARAQGLIAAIPGVRSVVGPAGLLALSVNSAGQVSAGPLLAGGSDDDATEAARRRMLHRGDAIGWFVSRDGTEVRLQLEVDDFPAIQGAVAAAASSSGLVLLSGGAPAQPLWPVPGDAPGPLGPWSPLMIVVLMMALPAGAAAVACRRSGLRALLAALAGGLGAAAPALVAPAARLRDVGFQVGFGAAALILAVATIAGITTAVRAARPRAGAAPDAGEAAPLARARLSFLLVVPALALMGAAVAASPGLTMGTQLWRPTPMFFVSVRGDMNQPVVLREVRRLTDFLRGEPGVAHAWSIADLFFAVPTPGQDFGSIPSDSQRVRAILARARTDAAVRLELTADHGEALVGVRLDDAAGVDRLAVLDRLTRYLQTAHRGNLVALDVTDRRVDPALRAFGRGILAADARERVLRICARSGRNLGDTESEAIERAVRRAALLPSVDVGRMRAEAAGEIDRFLEELAVAEAHVGLPRPAERARLTDQLWAEPPGGHLADFVGPLRVVYGKRLAAAALEERAGQLRARLADVRRRHSAEFNFNQILAGADLPSEGVLSEEVRDATLDAMGPLVGVPAAAGAPRALTVDAAAVGGVACDRALSDAWLPRLKLGVLIVALLLALLLVLSGGATALGWWPLGLALAAPLVLVPVIAAVPVGSLYLAAIGGALAGGGALALACGAGRRSP